LPVNIRVVCAADLKGWWHDATLFVYFDILYFTVHSFHHIHTIHSPIAIRRGSSPSPHRWSAQREKPSLGAEPRIELAPALQQIDALPTELGCTLTELRHTLLNCPFRLFAIGKFYLMDKIL
jgi:hypothetical protein